MRIQARTVIYKTYYIETDVREIESLDGVDGLIEWYVKNDLKKESTSEEIVIDKTVTPDNQEDFNYMESKDISLEKAYEEDELKAELNGIYELELGLEDDERIAF